MGEGRFENGARLSLFLMGGLSAVMASVAFLFLKALRLVSEDIFARLPKSCCTKELFSSCFIRDYIWQCVQSPFPMSLWLWLMGTGWRQGISVDIGLAFLFIFTDVGLARW